MKKPSLKARFSYWFDNQMAKGSLALTRLLIWFTLTVSISVALLLFFLHASEEDNFIAVLWGSLMTVINADMPAFEDGGPSYLVLTTIAAVSGLFVTSVLVGIVSSAIEDKINDLRRGNSTVLESGHIVVLGFYPGEYTLLKQLVLAAAEQPCCIVVAEDMERDKMEEYISDNVDVPKNVRIICRTADIFDPKTLEKCSIATCRSVIVSPTDDNRTIKALLAVSTIIHSAENSVRVGAIISKDEYQFPPSIAARHNVTTLQTNDTLARIIAHSCTQPGLSETFKEMFNFEGSEMYCVDLPGSAGMTFEQLTCCLDGGVPLGLSRGGDVLMNPAAGEVIQEGDKLLVFSEENDTFHLVPMPDLPEVDLGALPAGTEEGPGKVVILGCNETIETILRELPEDVNDVLIAGKCDRELIQEAVVDRKDMNLTFFEGDYTNTAVLSRLARQAAHIVVLSDHEEDEEESDMKNIFMLLNLRDLKIRFGLSYNITLEMRREHNQGLVVTDDNTDYVVSSNMSALFLAQLAESPELTGAFRELLSNEGNELYLKTARKTHCAGARTVAELRKILLAQGYVMLGYMKGERFECTFNPPLNQSVSLEESDSVIVLGLK